MENRCRQTRQLAGFIQTQQRQQTGVFYFTRVRAVNPGDIAPDSYARNARQRANLRRRVVGTVTPQQDRFTGIAAANKAGNHQPFTRMLRQQLL